MEPTVFPSREACSGSAQRDLRTSFVRGYSTLNGVGKSETPRGIATSLACLAFRAGSILDLAHSVTGFSVTRRRAFHFLHRLSYPLLTLHLLPQNPNTPRLNPTTPFLIFLIPLLTARQISPPMVPRLPLHAAHTFLLCGGEEGGGKGWAVRLRS